MAHLRERHLSPLLIRAGGFWPVVGLLGLRQSGKSTLLKDFLNAGTYVTLDDEQAREDAAKSSKTFLQKLPRPLILDEVQRVPQLFESIKLLVDAKKRPGTFYLTGSSQFSSRLGIRESLTGRIGIHYLYPLTLAEIYKKPMEVKRANPLHKLGARFAVKEALGQLESGALPVPFFVRNRSLVKTYFQSWLETTLLRDAQRSYGRNYDPDMAMSIVTQMARAFTDGEYANLAHLKQDPRRSRRYLQAFEDIFLVEKIVPCDEAVGTDAWIFSDSGILSSICGTILGEGTHLSLIRSFVIKEVRALCEYSENRLRLEFFKTSRSAPVDFVWGRVPIKISVSSKNQFEYDLRSLRAGMRALKSTSGVLMTRLDEVVVEDGIHIVPWTYFS